MHTLSSHEKRVLYHTTPSTYLDTVVSSNQNGGKDFFFSLHTCTFQMISCGDRLLSSYNNKKDLFDASKLTYIGFSVGDH